MRYSLTAPAWRRGALGLDQECTHFEMMQAEFAPLRAVDGSLIPWPPHINVTLSPQHAGWTFKAFALYSTTFREVCLDPLQAHATSIKAL